MAKKVILALIILFLLVFLALNFLGNDSVDVYIDGENVTVNTYTLSSIDSKSLNSEICEYTLKVMNDSDSDVNTLKSGIHDLCSQYGMKDVKITVDSSIGENQIPVIVYVDGTSMLPTLLDGQTVLITKPTMLMLGIL